MKEYKYKINGNLYKVTVGNIEDNIADVEVNGTAPTTKWRWRRHRNPNPWW